MSQNLSSYICFHSQVFVTGMKSPNVIVQLNIHGYTRKSFLKLCFYWNISLKFVLQYISRQIPYNNTNGLEIKQQWQ